MLLFIVIFEILVLVTVPSNALAMGSSSHGTSSLAIKSAPPVKCVIFVHGHRTNDLSATSYSEAYGYWKGDGSILDGGLFNVSAIPFVSTSDGIQVATRYLGAPYHKFYVVGYDGTQAYYEAATSVAAQIVSAIQGGKDRGGNQCAGMAPGQFIVIAHSMGGTVMDFILGNSDPTDPYYDPMFEIVNQNILRVESLAGAHRGTYAAQAVCADTNSIFVNVAGSVIHDCNNATRSLFPNDPSEVPHLIGSIHTPIYLNGGSGALPTSYFLSGIKWIWSLSYIGPARIGVDDGVLSFASQFAITGDALAYLDQNGVASHFSNAFVNMSYSNENHNNSRRGIGDGSPQPLINGSICDPTASSQMEEINCRLNRI